MATQVQLVKSDGTELSPVIKDSENAVYFDINSGLNVGHGGDLIMSTDICDIKYVTGVQIYQTDSARNDIAMTSNGIIIGGDGVDPITPAVDINGTALKLNADTTGTTTIGNTSAGLNLYGSNVKINGEEYKAGADLGNLTINSTTTRGTTNISSNDNIGIISKGGTTTQYASVSNSDVVLSAADEKSKVAVQDGSIKINSDYLELTGATTITGNTSITGTTKVTGNFAQDGNIHIIGSNTININSAISGQDISTGSIQANGQDIVLESSNGKGKINIHNHAEDSHGSDCGIKIGETVSDDKYWISVIPGQLYLGTGYSTTKTLDVNIATKITPDGITTNSLTINGNTINTGEKQSFSTASSTYYFTETGLYMVIAGAGIYCDLVAVTKASSSATPNVCKVTNNLGSSLTVTSGEFGTSDTSAHVSYSSTIIVNKIY